MRLTKQNILFLTGLIIGAFLIGLFFIIPFIKERNFTNLLEKLKNSETLSAATLVVVARYEGEDSNLIAYHLHHRIHPGSNFKLFTAAASLQRLTPDFAFETKLYRRGNDLILAGSGDPSLKRNDLEKLVAGVKKYGKISGNIYYDDRSFYGEKFGPGWSLDWIDQYFAVLITGLQLNDNLLEVLGLENEQTGKFEITTSPLQGVTVVDERHILDNPEALKVLTTARFNEDGRLILEGETLENLPFRTSAVVRDPSLFTALVLKQELSKDGLILPHAKVLSFSGNDYGILLATHASRPLKDLIFQMLKFSKNNFAETLVRVLGEGSQANGAKLLLDFAEELDIPEDEFFAFDGSGLSPSTRVSADAILHLFSYVEKQSWKDLFWNALPESQVDGTLKFRFENAGLKNTVFAKTGTHEFASSLSGKIIRPESKKNILFSIHVFNHPFSTEESVQNIHPIIDKIVALLDKQF